MPSITYNPDLGDDISEVCQAACGIASREKMQVYFRVNGVSATVQPGERSGEILARWNRFADEKMRVYRENKAKQAE